MDANKCVIGRIKKFVRRVVTAEDRRPIEFVFLTLECIDGRARFIRIHEQFFGILPFDMIGRGQGYREPLIKITSVTPISVNRDMSGYADGDDVCFQLSDETIVRLLTPEEVRQLPTVVSHRPNLVAKFINVVYEWHREEWMKDDSECRTLSIELDGHPFQIKEFRKVGDVDELHLNSQKDYELHCVKPSADAINFGLFSYVKAV